MTLSKSFVGKLSSSWLFVSKRIFLGITSTVKPTNCCFSTIKNLEKSVKIKDLVIEKIESEEDEEDEFDSEIMSYFIDKAKDQMSAMDDIEYHDVESYDKRVFLKVVDIWLEEVGPTKKGHREFIQATLNCLTKFKVEKDTDAYLKLLDCFPHGQYTGITRSHPWKAAFANKLPDHELGISLMNSLSFYNAKPNGALYDKSLELFGHYSPVTRNIRNQLYWDPRMLQFSRFPIRMKEVDEMNLIEITFRGLRQMNPGAFVNYERIEVNCDLPVDKMLSSDQLDVIISSQSNQQKALLANHNTDEPIYIEGPQITYFAHKTVQYYVMKTSMQHSTDDVIDDVKPLTSKDWWSEFYKTEWGRERKLAGKDCVFEDESFLPKVNISEDHCLEKRKQEIIKIEKDIDEGKIFAIAATDHTSADALRCWIRGLLPYNPNLANCNVILKTDENSFMINAPFSDPNDEDEHF